jgi:hypothetical protein
MSTDYKTLIESLDDYAFEHCRDGCGAEADKLRDDVINALRDAWDRQIRFNKLWGGLAKTCEGLIGPHDSIEQQYVRDLLETTSE